MVEIPKPIDYLGSVTQHSSIYSDGETVVRIRNSEDSVGEFFRFEVDRDGELMFSEMIDEQSDSILSSIINRLTDQGSIAVMDAGCGTGRTLYAIRDQLLLTTNANPQDIVTVGVNDRDFSDESEDSMVREANRNGDINYVIADLESVDLEPESFDFITSYEALIHNEPAKLIRVIKNLLPSLKQNGAFVFDITEKQKDDPSVRTFLGWRLKQEGYSVFEYTKEWRKNKRQFVWIRPNQTD